MWALRFNHDAAPALVHGLVPWTHPHSGVVYNRSSIGSLPLMERVGFMNRGCSHSWVVFYRGYASSGSDPLRAVGLS
jgi:hypothetical protein